MRLATYNIRNLFLNGEGPDKPAKETRALGRMLSGLDADVVMLQEVGSQASLDQLNAELLNPYPFAAVLPGNSDRSIHLAVLAKNHGALTSHRHIPLDIVDAQVELRLQRDILRVEFDNALTLFGVHFKSRTNRSDQHVGADVIRAAECQVLCEVVQNYQRDNPNRMIVIGGDFNDRSSSDALAGLQALPFTDPMTERLRAAGRHPSTFWSKRRMRIDRFLLDDAHLNRVLDTTIHATRMAQVASDHYPVTLDVAWDWTVQGD